MASVLNDAPVVVKKNGYFRLGIDIAGQCLAPMMANQGYKQLMMCAAFDVGR
jgi:hypothetical protein